MVIDKWLYDVCGDDEMQFPSHRRTQFMPYMQHARFVSKQKAFVAGTFPYPSRSGAREIAALHVLLEAIGNKEREFLQKTQRTDEEITRVKQVIEERTMGTSALTAATPPPGGPAPSGNSHLALGDDDSLAPPDEREARLSQKRKFAERYVTELYRKAQETRERRALLDPRHAQLLRDREQMDEEFEVLKRTEEMVVGRHTKAQAACALEEQLCAEDRAEWEAMSTGMPFRPSVVVIAHSKTHVDPQPTDATPVLGASGVPATEVAVRDSVQEEAATITVGAGRIASIDLGDGGAPPTAAAPRPGTLEDGVRDRGWDTSPPPLLDADHVVNPDALDPLVASLPSSLADGAAAVAGGPWSHPDTGENQPLPLSGTGTAATVSSQRALDDDDDSVRLLERLRSALADASKAAFDMKRQMRNEEQTHMGRFRRLRQRLEDLQNVVAARRVTEEQLRGQVRVISTVIKDTAARLSEAPEGGYMESFHRLNKLLAERTSEYWHGGSPTLPKEDLKAYTTEVRPVMRSGPTPVSSTNVSAANTPMRSTTSVRNVDAGTPQRHTAILSNSSASLTPDAMGGGVETSKPAKASPLRHRSRYELVRHLQRWEQALQLDRAALMSVAGCAASDRAAGTNIPRPGGDGSESFASQNMHLRQQFTQLKKLVLTRG